MDVSWNRKRLEIFIVENRKAQNMIYSAFISKKIRAKLRERRMSWRDGIFPHQEGRAVSMCADLTFQTLFTVANLEAGVEALGLLWCREEVSEPYLGGP